MTQSSVLSLAFAVAAGVAMTLAAGLAAHAEPVIEALPSAEVSYADLDLSRAEGRQVLTERIHAAAHVVCGSEPAHVDLGRRNMFQHCVQGAEDRAFIEMQLLIAEATRSSSQPIRVAEVEPLR